MQENIFENADTVVQVLGVTSTLFLGGVVTLFIKNENLRTKNEEKLLDLTEKHEKETKELNKVISGLQTQLVDSLRENIETITKLTTLIESLPKQDKLTSNFNTVMIALVELKSLLREYMTEVKNLLNENN
jgi:anion-transporting  ArsA/GET3 family ATPase